MFLGEQEKGAFVEVVILTPVHEMKIKIGKHETKILLVLLHQSMVMKKIIIKENRIKCKKTVWTGTTNAPGVPWCYRKNLGHHGTPQMTNKVI